MDFEYSPKTRERIEMLEAFMEENVYPREREHHDFVMDPANLWKQPPLVEELKAKARRAGIWNWFLPPEYGDWSPGLTNVEFAPVRRGHGTHAVVVRSVQLLGTRPWQHGGAGALRFARTAGPVAATTARRRDPLHVRHDRTAGGVIGRDEYATHHGARRRRVRASTGASGGAATSCIH